jgi:hypothetical protein
VLDELQERPVRPVQVLEGDDEGPSRGQYRAQTPDPPEELLYRELLVRESDCRRNPSHRVVLAGTGERRKLRARRCRVVALDDARRLANRLDDRPEGDAVAVGETAPAYGRRKSGDAS